MLLVPCSFELDLPNAEIGYALPLTVPSALPAVAKPETNAMIVREMELHAQSASSVLIRVAEAITAAHVRTLS